ncbi:hypothetical protein F5880DRAFT_154995 [Lentinula raphanica]|nr:hypothetical protein F5880DRAFT_154995 [Lentinula raphanica]
MSAPNIAETTTRNDSEAPKSPSSNTATSDVPDEHAVSEEEAELYYTGLPSKPRLVYRTGKKWSPPRGPWAHPPPKELRGVSADHPMKDVWNEELGVKIVEVMDDHKIKFTSIVDLVRFRTDHSFLEGEVEEPSFSPVTIWIGVFPGSTTATAAHNAAQDVLALLKNYQITDVDVDFRESVTWP